MAKKKQLTPEEIEEADLQERFGDIIELYRLIQVMGEQRIFLSQISVRDKIDLAAALRVLTADVQSRIDHSLLGNDRSDGVSIYLSETGTKKKRI